MVLSFVSERRVDVKNSLTEKCENWITGEPSTSTMDSRLEHVDNTAYTGSSRRNFSSNFGIGLTSKSKARKSASSSTRSGREATATHWNRRWAYSQFDLISRNVRSYVSSSVSGNSARARRRRAGTQ